MSDVAAQLMVKLRDMHDRRSEFNERTGITYVEVDPACVYCEDLRFTFTDPPPCNTVIPCTRCNLNLYEKWKAGRLGRHRKAVGRTSTIAESRRVVDEYTETTRKDLF